MRPQRLGNDQLDPVVGKQVRNRGAVERAVGLDPRTPYRRTLAAIEHAAVDRSPVRGPGHETVEDIELAHEMALADAANGRVARHLANIPGAKGQQADARAAPGRSGGGFAAGVAGTNHKDVEHGRAALSCISCFTWNLFAEAKAPEQRVEHDPRRPRCRSADRTPSRAARNSSAMSSRSIALAACPSAAPASAMCAA